MYVGYLNNEEDGQPASVRAVFSRETGESFTGCCMKGAESQLHMASVEGDTQLVEQLVRSGADVNSIFKTVPALYLATKFEQTDTVRMLIKLKCNVNAKTIEIEQTALHCAVSLGNIEICRVLCDHGANINQQDHDGATPLMLASSNGLLKVLEFLIRRGADVNIPMTRGLTPLAAAVQNGNGQAVRCLLQHKAKLGSRDIRGNDALFHAVKGGQVETCRLLIDAGACPNHPNYAREYPIGIAAMYGNSAITDILIGRGCKLNVISGDGTPVYAAVERQHINVLRRLVSAGADVGFITQRGRLPLIEALHQHTPNYDIILELLRAGSDIDSAICDCHDSPVNMVLSKCNIPIVVLLIQADTKLGVITESKMQEMKTYCTFTYDLIRDYEMAGVQNLKAMCRKVIKRSVGTVRYKHKIQQLPTPAPLKKYLYHEDAFLPSSDPCRDPLDFDSETGMSEVNPMSRFSGRSGVYNKK